MGVITNIFLNRHSEVRPGWRIFLFFLILGIGTALFIIPVSGLLAGQTTALDMLLGLAAVLATYCMTRFVNRKPFTAVGLSLHPATFRELGWGLLLGFGMMSVIFLAEYLLGEVRLVWRDFPPLKVLAVLGSGFVTFLVAAAAEELLFRGYVFQTLIQWITFLPAMLLMALVFALSHLANPHITILSTLNVGLAGIWLSFAYMKTRSLWLPIGLHFSWNFTQTSLYAFRTSGLDFGGRELFASIQSGPDWLTGGAFGPEGGVLATIALIACTWYILKSTRFAAPEGIITLDSLEDVLSRQRELTEKKP